MQQLVDYKFNIQLANWTPLAARYYNNFNNDEIASLSEAFKRYNDMSRTIVYLAFENFYATGGGLGAVIKFLPEEIVNSGERFIFISPFFSNISSMQKAVEAKEIKEVYSDGKITVGKKQVNYTLYSGTFGSVNAYYIKAEGFFSGTPTPYDVDSDTLLQDSFFFTSATVDVLNRTKNCDNLLIHANDWETAPISISILDALIDGKINSAKTVITLHNSYDVSLPKKVLTKFKKRVTGAKTVLQYALPYFDAPISTVSWPYAAEMIHDTLQSGYFTSHLIDVFRENSPVGINNGLFGSNNREMPTEKKELLKFKKKQATALWDILDNNHDKRIYGKIKIPKKTFDKPLFFMSGRMDLMQKGFDTIFHAFRKMKRGSAALVFSPSITNDSERKHLQFFIDIAEELDGDIEIWPFRIDREAYGHFLSGASWLLMPSIYEPFGAANEGFLHSTPVIARATGGLWTQIVSHKEVAIPHFLTTKRDGGSALSTGILYREEYIGNADDWRSIFSLPCEKRVDNPLYQSIVDSAYFALLEGVKLFNTRSDYLEMILSGGRSLDSFSWMDSVKKYKLLYNSVQRSAI